MSDEFNDGQYAIKKIDTSNINVPLENFSDKIVDSFTMLINKLEGIADRVSISIPVASGKVVPYNTSIPKSSASDSAEIYINIKRAVSDGFTAALSDIYKSSGNDTTTILVQLDGDTIYRKVVQLNNKSLKINGSGFALA